MSDLYNYRAIFISADEASTITADIDLGFGAWLYHEKLRLMGLNLQPCKAEENPERLTARDFVRELLTDGDAIEITTYKDAINQDGHWQAEVVLSDGRSLNQVLMDADYAKQS
ncbi:MAG: hypothetical protein ACFCU8_09665 [Thermosynechococcaceae cyanobacterium]